MKSAGINTEQAPDSGESITLAASWVGRYQWQNEISLTSRSITVNVHEDSLFVVRDEHSCLVDSLKIKLEVTTESPTAESPISIYPNPANGTFSVDVGLSGLYRLDMFDALGRLVMQQNLGLQNTFSCQSLPPGVYFVILAGELKTLRRKLVLQ